MDKATQKSNAELDRPNAGLMPQGILVLGMHRSGTSALTRMLNMLGCALSENLLGPGDGNESGHWEPVEAIRLNDEILASAGSSHDDWGPINADWRKSAIRPQMIGRVQKIVADHIGIGPLFAIKDPRICRLADVWIEAMGNAGAEPLVLMMVRNPSEVATSLEARDLMAPAYGELLWLRHVLDAEVFSRGQRRVVCQYDELMRNWRGLVRKMTDGLGVSFPRNSRKTHADIDDFLSGNLRHHHADPEDLIHNTSHPEWLRVTYAIMLKWSAQGEDAADYAELDRLRAELNRSHDAFARLLMDPHLVGEPGSAARLHREVTSLQELLESREQALRESELAMEELRADAGRREAELAAQGHADAAKASVLEAEVERLNTELAEKSRELVGAQAALDGAQSATESERQRREEAESRHLQTSSELQDQMLRNAEHAGQIAAMQSSISQRQEELAQLYERLNEVTRACSLAEAKHEHERQRRIELEEQLASTSESAEAEIRDLKSQMDEARRLDEQRLGALVDELEKATALLSQQDVAAEKLKEELGDQTAQCRHLSETVSELSSAVDLARMALEETQQAAAQRVEALTGDLAKITKLLSEQEEATGSLVAELGERTAESRRLSERVQELAKAAESAENARMDNEIRLAARFEELAQITAIAAQEAEQASRLQAATEWLRATRQLEEGFPAWWSLMPEAWQRARRHQRYHRAGLFDAEAYLALYPDVAAQGMDPLRHYVLHGMAEGRIRTVPAQNPYKTDG